MLFSKLTENKIRALEIKNIADMNILIDRLKDKLKRISQKEM